MARPTLGIDAEVQAYESSKLTDVILEGEFDAFEWGWYVEPDPDSMLSYMTCGQRGNWSDSWYCNEEYDALYEQQHVEMDDAARAEQVKQMQEILYTDAPYLVTAYSSIGEAFRSDRFACFQPQPDPGGIWLVQYGAQNYLNMRPAAEAGDCDGIANAVGAGGTEAAADGGSSDDGDEHRRPRSASAWPPASWSSLGACLLDASAGHGGRPRMTLLDRRASSRPSVRDRVHGGHATDATS